MDALWFTDFEGDVEGTLLWFSFNTSDEIIQQKIAQEVPVKEGTP